MYTPKMKTKRVLGLALAAALALAGTVAFAGNSQATTTPSVTLTPATGNAAGGTVLAVKGKGFEDVTLAPLVLSVKFSSAACTTTVATGTAAASFNVATTSRVDVTTPALLAGTWYICLFDASSGTANILGQGTLVTGTAPTVTSVTPNNGAQVTTASILGGSTVAVLGANYTTKTKVSVGGVAAKTTYISATKLSAVVPAHTAGALVLVTVTSEFGSVTSTAGSASLTYVPVITVAAPNYGSGTAGTVVSLTGLGFSSYTFGAAATNDVIVFVPAGITITTATTLASLNPCTSVQVTTDKTLSCQAPVLSAGAYTVQIVTVGSTVTLWASSVTGVSHSATYTSSTL